MFVVLSFATEIQWHEGHSMARALRRLGHEVRVVNVAAHPLQDHCETSAGFPADVHIDQVFGDSRPEAFFYIEPRGLLPRGLERAPCRTVCFLCDTILGLAPRQAIAQLFDEVVLYHLNAVDGFPNHGAGHVHVSPFAVDSELFTDRGHTRDLDVVYVGSLDDVWAPRRRLVDRLKSEFTMNDVERRLSAAEVSALYARAKIIVNVCINGTINPRIFDAMGAGALLLNGATPAALAEMFTEGEHYVAFRDEEDAAAKVRYYLANEAERARIAKAGNAAVHAKHTYDVRMKELMDWLAATPPKLGERVASRLDERRRAAVYEGHYRQAGHVEALFRRSGEFPAWSVGRIRTFVRAVMTAFRHSGR